MELKVAHFTFEYPPRTTGGLGTYIQSLAEYQREVGDQVDVFFLDEGKAPDNTISLPSYSNGKPVDYTISEIGIRSGRVDYDIAVCHDWDGVLASRALWRRSTPLIATCHLPLAWDVGYHTTLAIQLEFFVLAQADAVIAVSKAVSQHIGEKYPFAREKTRVVYNGTNTDFFSPLLGAASLEGGGANTQEAMVLYVGRFCNQKGVDLLPDIFSRLKQRYSQLRFAVIGTGPLEDDLLQALYAADLQDSLEFHNFSSLETVRALYRRATVVIMPSRYEPFGLVATESMATGTPVVASNVGGLSEVVVNGYSGFLVPPDDVQGFVEAISALLNDEKLLKEMGATARMEAIHKFSRINRFENTRQVYRDLATAWQSSY